MSQCDREKNVEVLREQESSRKIDLRLVYEAFKYTCVTQKLI